MHFEVHENENVGNAIRANFARVENSMQELIFYKAKLDDWLKRFEGILDRVRLSNQLTCTYS